MPNVMVALTNIGGALCSTPQSLADAYYYMPCSNAAKTPKPLKVAGVPQTPETISAASGPKFTVLWAHVGEILLLNSFFSDCRYMPWLGRYSPTKLRDGAQMDHMQIICTSLQTDNHISTSPLSFYRPDALLAAEPTASKH